VSERRSLWHGVALVATLGLAAAIAVAAVTRNEPAPAPSATPTASVSPTASHTPGTLDGAGPYVIYASGRDVFAYDIAAGTSTPLGALSGTPVAHRSEQPGRGQIVAVPASDLSVWTVKRAGLKRVDSVPAATGSTIDGSAVSDDERRVAVALQQAPFSVVLFDLRNGKTTEVIRKRPTGYPDGQSLPIGWGLGGTVLYQIPICECDGVERGLFALDLTAGSSAAVPELRSTLLLGRSVVAQNGQGLYYGTRTPRRCRTNEVGNPCEGAPFTLRRLVAGRASSETLARSSSASFDPLAISPDGTQLLVVRVATDTGASRVEMWDASGIRLPALHGIPKGALPVALLADGSIIVETQTAPIKLYVVRDGHAKTVATIDSDNPFELAYLGWLS